MDQQTTVTVRPPLWLPVIVVLIGGLFFLIGKHIERQPVPPYPGTVTVSGEGKVSAVPDIAELTFGVQTGPQRTAKIAVEKISTSMQAILAAVKEQDVEDRDIHTEQFWLNPVYDWNDGRQTLRGYEASQTLRVKVRDLDKVGDVLSKATSAGANQAGGVQFTIDNPDAKKAEAREQAIDEAKERAQVLASQLGVRLGKIQSYNEGSGPFPYPMMMRSDAPQAGGGTDAMMEKSIPLPSGEQDIVINVNITYELR